MAAPPIAAVVGTVAALLSITSFAPQILKIWKAQADETQADGVPGSVSEVTPQEMIVNTGRNRLIVREVQLEGKRRMAVSEFLRGNHIEKGTMLGLE